MSYELRLCEVPVTYLYDQVARFWRHFGWNFKVDFRDAFVRCYERAVSVTGNNQALI